VLSDVANVTAMPLLITFKRSLCLGEVSDDWRRANVTPGFKKDKTKDLMNCRLVNHTSVPGKLMEQLFLETASRHMKDKKVTMNIWHGFMKWKSGLSNILPFYKDKASLVDEGRAVDVVYLDFSKALGTISHNIFIDKLTKYKSDRCTVK